MKESKLILQDPNLSTIDPFQASVGRLLVIMFPKTNSKNYPFAVNIAEGAERYAILQINGKQMHIAAFGKTQDDAGRASALLSYIQGWKSALVFANGKIVRDSYRLSEVIACFLNSCQCSDANAYCHKIIDDPFADIPNPLGVAISIELSAKLGLPEIKKEVRIDRFAFPCKHLLPWFQFEENHPSKLEDQIQASGVEHGCNICPNFIPRDFKKVGYRSFLSNDFE